MAAKASAPSKRLIRNTRRGKKQITIQDLNAWEQAYGHRLSNSRRFRKILPYVFSTTFFATVLYWRIPVSVLVFFASIFLFWSSVLSRETYVGYVRSSYSERNRVINLLTQALAGENATLFSALKQTIPSMRGELKHEFQILQGMLARSATREEIHDWFVNEISKYREDVVFGQYLEQLETMNTEGLYASSTFLNLSHYHNDLYNKQTLYINAKQQRKQEVYVIVAIVMVLLVVMSVMIQGHGTWVKVFAHSIVGEIASTLFLIVYAIIIRNFLKYYYDESVTTYGEDKQMRSIVRNSRRRSDIKLKKQEQRESVILRVDPSDRKKFNNQHKKITKKKIRRTAENTPSGGFGNV